VVFATTFYFYQRPSCESHQTAIHWLLVLRPDSILLVDSQITFMFTSFIEEQALIAYHHTNSKQADSNVAGRLTDGVRILYGV